MHMDRQLKSSTRSERGTGIVEVAGRNYLGALPAFRKRLLAVLKRTQRLAINLTAVEYIDSSGIASLLEVLKEARKTEKRVVLFGLTGAVLQVLELTRLTRVFEIL